MSSDPQMVEFVLEMLQGLGEPRIRRMFSVHCIYLNDKPVGFLVDNHLFVKTNKEMRIARPDLPTQKLFEEAVNPMWIIDDPDDIKKVRELYKMALEWLPEKKVKKGPKTQASKRIRRADGEGSPWNDPTVVKRLRKKH